MRVQIRFHCPACEKPWEILAINQGKKVRCSCGHRFVIPLPHPVPEPTPPAVLGPEEFQATTARVLAALAELSERVGSGLQLPPGLFPLIERRKLEDLYEQEIATLEVAIREKAERLATTEQARDEALARCRKLEGEQQRIDTAVARVARDFEQALGCLLPSIAFMKGSIEFMVRDLADYGPVLRVLHLLQTEPSLLKFRDFKSVAGWCEIDKHIGSGQGDDVRVYVRKQSGTNGYLVLVSNKNSQNRDKARMQSV